MPKAAKSSDLQEVYVAFSIHGSNCFITAVTEIPKADAHTSKFKIGDFTFTKGYSRASSKNNAIKLLWSHLDGLKTPQLIWEKFQLLAEAGWSVSDADFIKKHKIDAQRSDARRSINLAMADTQSLTGRTPSVNLAISPPAVDPMAAKMANLGGYIPAKQGGSLSWPSSNPAFAELDKPIRGVMDYAGTETGRFPKPEILPPGSDIVKAATDVIYASDPSIIGQYTERGVEKAPEPGSVDDGSRESNDAEKSLVATVVKDGEIVGAAVISADSLGPTSGVDLEHTKPGDPTRGVIENVEGLKPETEINRDDKGNVIGELYRKPNEPTE